MKIQFFSSSHAIRVQSSNTKSRVETQIKLTIQLLGNQWSWLRVSESLLYKKKVIRQHKDGVLNLEAYVVSDSNPSKKVSMCQGCARREVISWQKLNSNFLYSFSSHIIA